MSKKEREEGGRVGVAVGGGKYPLGYFRNSGTGLSLMQGNVT